MRPVHLNFQIFFQHGKHFSTYSNTKLLVADFAMASARPQSVRPTRTIRMPPISSFYKVSKPISKKKFCSNLRTIFKAKDTARFRTRKLCSDLDLTTNTKIKPRPTVSPLTAKPVAEPRFSATGSPYFSPPTTAELEWLYPTRAGWSWSPFTPVVCENKFTYPTATQSQSDLVAENNIVESEKSLKVRENAAYCSLQALVRGKTEIRELGEGEFTFILHCYFYLQRRL